MQEILQEAVQEKITIEEFFEPFEIQWLLAYIYFHCKHIDTLDLLLTPPCAPLIILSLHRRPCSQDQI